MARQTTRSIIAARFERVKRALNAWWPEDLQVPYYSSGPDEDEVKGWPPHMRKLHAAREKAEREFKAAAEVEKKKIAVARTRLCERKCAVALDLDQAMDDLLLKVNAGEIPEANAGPYLPNERRVRAMLAKAGVSKAQAAKFQMKPDWC